MPPFRALIRGPTPLRRSAQGSIDAGAQRSGSASMRRAASDPVRRDPASACPSASPAIAGPVGDFGPVRRAGLLVEVLPRHATRWMASDAALSVAERYCRGPGALALGPLVA